MGTSWYGNAWEQSDMGMHGNILIFLCHPLLKTYQGWEHMGLGTHGNALRFESPVKSIIAYISSTINLLIKAKIINIKQLVFLLILFIGGRK